MASVACAEPMVVTIVCYQSLLSLPILHRTLAMAISPFFVGLRYYSSHVLNDSFNYKDYHPKSYLVKLSPLTQLDVCKSGFIPFRNLPSLSYAGTPCPHNNVPDQRVHTAMLFTIQGTEPGYRNTDLTVCTVLSPVCSHSFIINVALRARCLRPSFHINPSPPVAQCYNAFLQRPRHRTLP